MGLFTPLPNYQLSSRGRVLSLAQPHVMGILNVTPDSFSDGGEYNEVDKALTRCREMIAAGVSVIDIGGESTRPNAPKVSTDEEMARVIPVVSAIREQYGETLWLSIDTSNPAVIEAAVHAGADIWNDVRALKRDGAAAMAAQLDIPVILMHMRGEPTTMDGLAHYNDVVTEVTAELQQRIDAVVSAGVARHNIVIDPGFGFAKQYDHHCALLGELQALQSLGLPMMFGVSRKRYLAEVLSKRGNTHHDGHAAASATDPAARDMVGTAAALFAIQQGACLIRTHNVTMISEAIALWQQLSEYHQRHI